MMTSEYASESIGFKVLLGGFGGSVIAWFNALDWVAVITLAVMLGGGFLQVMGHLRARRDEKLKKEQAVRDKEEAIRAAAKHELEMAILRKKLEES